jgi:hypothetical protein
MDAGRGLGHADGMMSTTPDQAEWEAMTIDQQREWAERTREGYFPKASAPARPLSLAAGTRWMVNFAAVFWGAIVVLGSLMEIGGLTSRTELRILAGLVVVPALSVTVWMIRNLLLCVLEYLAAHTPPR